MCESQMTGKYKRPGERAISHRFRMNPKYTREYNDIMQVGMNSSMGGQAREQQRGSLGDLRSRWQGGVNSRGEHQVVGKKLCHQIRKGLHWCNYYKNANVYFPSHYPKTPFDPGTQLPARPYKSVISRCVLRHGRNGPCEKWEHSRIQPKHRTNRKTGVHPTDEYGHQLPKTPRPTWRPHWHDQARFEKHAKYKVGLGTTTMIPTGLPRGSPPKFKGQPYVDLT